MNQVAFLKLIQKRVMEEAKALTMPPEMMIKHQSECQAFEAEFRALCIKHGMAGQVFGVNLNSDKAFKTLFLNTVGAPEGQKVPAVEIGMGMQHWMANTGFGKAVATVMATLTEYQLSNSLNRQFDQALPANMPIPGAPMQRPRLITTGGKSA